MLNIKELNYNDIDSVLRALWDEYKRIENEEYKDKPDFGPPKSNNTLNFLLALFNINDQVSGYDESYYEDVGTIAIQFKKEMFLWEGVYYYTTLIPDITPYGDKYLVLQTLFHRDTDDSLSAPIECNVIYILKHHIGWGKYKAKKLKYKVEQLLFSIL